MMVKISKCCLRNCADQPLISVSSSPFAPPNTGIKRSLNAGTIRSAHAYTQVYEQIWGSQPMLTLNWTQSHEHTNIHSQTQTHRQTTDVPPYANTSETLGVDRRAHILLTSPYENSLCKITHIHKPRIDTASHTCTGWTKWQIGTSLLLPTQPPHSCSPLSGR